MNGPAGSHACVPGVVMCESKTNLGHADVASKQEGIDFM